eukprot:TRINITY_DN30017_c0_g1_i1.p1 TRINITY_DN30017_c0_g1~~TRINITY_DN30017_c0_g1_i1.p1  ORF type:complete len:586 (+),score=256.31 TRINITY_DN30017_c0_g1_i1:114-1871(+)
MSASPIRAADDSLLSGLARSPPRHVAPQSIVLDRSVSTSNAPDVEDEDASVTISRIAAFVKNSSARAGEAEDMERLLYQRDTHVHQLKTQLDQKNAEWHREREEHRKQIQLLTREKDAAVKAAAEHAEVKAEYDRLHGEYNTALHNSLSLQRETAQLRTELLEVQSKGSREERQRVRAERWEMEKVHSEEMTTLRKRIDVLKDEHSNQIAKLQASFEEDRTELLRRLSNCVPKSEMETLRAHLRHTENELAIANRRKMELLEEAQELVPMASLEAAEEEQTRRGEQVGELMEDLAAERTARRTDQEQLVALSRLSQDMTRKITHLDNSLAAKEAELASLAQQRLAEGHHAEALRDKYQLLERFHRESERTLEKLQQDYDTAVQGQQSSAAALQAAREEHKNDRDRQEAAAAEAQRRAQDQREEVVSLKTQVAGLQSRVSILETDLDNQTSKAISQQRDASKKLEDLSRQTYSLQDRLHATLSDKEKAELEISRLHRALEDVDAQCEGLLQERARGEEHLAGLVAEVEAQKQARTKADESLTEVRAKLKARAEHANALSDKLKTHEKLLAEHLKPYFTAAKKAGLL